MNINALKLHLLQQLLAIEDEETLQRVQEFFDELELTEEDLEELKKRRADRLSGKSVGLSAEESIQRLRSDEDAKSMVNEEAVAYGMTDEELAELQEIEQRQVIGEDEYLPMEEAMRMAREALK